MSDKTGVKEVLVEDNLSRYCRLRRPALVPATAGGDPAIRRGPVNRRLGIPEVKERR